MYDLFTLIAIPFLIAVIVLFIEYWIVQPIRNRQHKDNVPEISSYNKKDPLFDHLRRLIRQFFAPNTYRLSSTIVRSVGDFISMVPIWLISTFTSLLAVSMSFPLYLSLYASEKFSICKFHPSCKEYLVLSIETHGPIRGFVLGLNRFGKCNVWTKGYGLHDPMLMNVTDQDMIDSIIAKGNWWNTLSGFILLAILLIWVIFEIIVHSSDMMDYLAITNPFMGFVITTIVLLFVLSATALAIGLFASQLRSRVFRRIFFISVVTYILIFIIRRTVLK